MGAGARTATVADRALTDLLAAAPQRRPRPTMQPDRTWYRITNQDTSTAELWIYDEIGYWGTSAQDLVDQLKTITASNIKVHMNSPGGEVFDGVAIYNCLKMHPASIHVCVEGIAASAASFISMAADTGQLTMCRNATMMIHDASAIGWGNAADLRELADLLDKISDNIADIYAQRAGGTVEQWRERMLATTWYTGAEAVEAGLADAMTDPDPDPEHDPEHDPDEMPDMNNRWDLSIFPTAGGGQAAGSAPAPAAGGTQGGGVPPAPDPDDEFAELAAGLLNTPTVDDLLASLREAHQ